MFLLVNDRPKGPDIHLPLTHYLVSVTALRQYAALSWVMGMVIVGVYAPGILPFGVARILNSAARLYIASPMLHEIAPSGRILQEKGIAGRQVGCFDADIADMLQLH